MGILKPVLIVVILSSAFLCNNAWATTPPRVGSTPDLAKQDAKPGATPAPAKKHPKRRAVRQHIDGTPAASIPPPRIVPLLPPPIGVPPPLTPHILNGCTGLACIDASGAQYHGGVGTTLLGPEGRVCSNNGITVQCF